MATITAEQVREFCALLTSGAMQDDPEAQIELISSLEMLKSAACGVQAEATMAYDAARRSAQAAAGVPAARQGCGIASEVALARKESPHRGQLHVGFAKVAHAEMPHTLARLKDGSLNEFRAHQVARETACLSVEQRLFVDEELCADPTALIGVGTRELIVRARRMAAELDPAAVARRALQAEADRTVTVRPAPDTMGYLTALMPVPQAVAAYAALTRDAQAMRSAGDPRSKGQLMADLLLVRVTGVDLPDSASIIEDGVVPAPAVPVTLDVTISDAALAGGHAPGEVRADGVAPVVVPAEVARILVARALAQGVGAWFRQLYLNPIGRLVAMTSRQRCFPDGLAELLAYRGAGICATPWCDAPVRHADHITPIDEGGQTSADNGQGLCEACNHAKQAPGWRQHVVSQPRERHQVETITPSGHRYLATAPAPVGWREPRYIQLGPGRYRLVA
ncbi:MULTISPECIES: HNH endonuclease [Nocardioides]|uniref:HNH endonuclease n=1 Tax=Nocardioides vastitatis TaxID=2568655 RepID=A0ABW0ZJ01_9ACTN|nr:HNH endonuclease signature motif containing protein [Nocardioides sp.]